jgi:hypothetical protein
MKTRVLWVEDSARLELRNLLGPVNISGEYDLCLAEDATSAMRHLQMAVYDAVILDMRIPPGVDERWIGLYRERDEDKATARLGLELAKWMFDGHSFSYPPPTWIKPHQVAVFTVENDSALREHLRNLHIEIFEHKIASIPDTILVDLIERIKGHLSRKG